jgi:leucyl-tRNA---protein transferase
VREFAASRSQRRVQKRNADVRVTIEVPNPTDQKWLMDRAYRHWQHDDGAGDEREDFEEFLYQSPLEEAGRSLTLEMCYWIEDRLAAAGIVDVCPQAISSVYFYFDPLYARRSLGVFSALCEIEECRRRGLAYWYIGFYIRECRRMNYKAQYRPHELLGRDGRWQRPSTEGVQP